MTDAERALIEEDPLKLFGWETGIVSAVCTFVLTFLVVSLLAIRLSFDIVVRVALAVAAVASVAMYTRIQLRERGELRDRAAGLRREAAPGHVQSTVYTIRDVVAVEELEDEGLSYYLLLDDGQTLFLSGQYLYEPAENGFPWESFEVVRVPVENWVLTIAPLGPSVEPSWTRRPFSESECEAGIPSDGTIEQRDFAALKVFAPHAQEN